MDEGPPPREHFAEPPLAEFVLEFQFDVGQGDGAPRGESRGLAGGSRAPAGAAADEASPFRAFYAAVRDYFPVAERIETANVGFDVEVNADPLGRGAPGAAVAVPPEVLQEVLRDAVRRSTVLHRFGRTDRGMVLTVGPDLLGLSVLPRQIAGGYPGWEVVRDLALRLLRIHRSLWHTGVLHHVGVRYINVIPVMPSAFRLGDYVEDAPGLVPPRLLEERNPFSLELTHAVAMTPGAVHEQSVNLSAGPAQPPAAGGELVLSIDERFISLDDAELGEPDTVCNILHDAAYRIFMELLAPDVRITFKPKPHTELAPI